MAERYAFVNGEAGSALGVDDRGLGYGHGVFETMRVHSASIPLWRYHRQRLLDGATRLGITIDAQQVEEDLEKALAAIPADGMIKLTLTGGIGPRGYRHDAQTPPTRIIQGFPSPPADNTPVTLQLCEYRLPINPRLAGLKHLNRLDQVLAAAEVGEDREGLLLDADDRVTETLSHNLYACIGDHWFTPSLAGAGVAGVMRRFLLEAVFPPAGINVTETTLSVDDIAGADELFICNSVVGIRPVAALTGLGQWRTFDGAARLQQKLAELVPCFAK